MKIVWTVSTYNRPHLLPRTIRCFQEQTYANRGMVILDDAAQYTRSDADMAVELLEENLWLISRKERYASLGEKRNVAAHWAGVLFPGVKAIMPVDDDDIPLPWHTARAAEVLKTTPWSRPGVVLAPHRTGERWAFVENYTGRRDDPTREKLYHPSWAFDLATFWRVGGYPEGYSGSEDKHLMMRLARAGVPHGDPCEFGHPSYVYCWGHNNISGHLSREDPDGVKAWPTLAQEVQKAVLTPWVPPFDLHHPDIINQGSPLPRPF